MRSHPGGGSAMRLRRWMANRRLRTKFVLILLAAMPLLAHELLLLSPRRVHRTASTPETAV